MDVSWARPRIHSPNIHVREKITRKTEPERVNPKRMLSRGSFSSNQEAEIAFWEGENVNEREKGFLDPT